MGQDKRVRIFFGRSEYGTRFGSVIRDDEYTVYIPVEDSFPVISDTFKADPVVSLIDNRPVVLWSKESHPDEDDKAVILVWVEERSEWVAVLRTSWAESGSANDQSYDGPFALCDGCLSQIVKAYRLPPDIQLSQITTTNPAEFNKVLSA